MRLLCTCAVAMAVTSALAGDFRDSRWGDSREEVEAAEGAPRMEIALWGYTSVYYDGELAGREATVNYLYDRRGRLIQGTYDAVEADLETFEAWENELRGTYGEAAVADEMLDADDEEAAARYRRGDRDELAADLLAEKYRLGRTWETETTFVKMSAEKSVTADKLAVEVDFISRKLGANLLAEAKGEGLPGGEAPVLREVGGYPWGATPEKVTAAVGPTASVVSVPRTQYRYPAEVAGHEADAYFVFDEAERLWGVAFRPQTGGFAVFQDWAEALRLRYGEPEAKDEFYAAEDTYAPYYGGDAAQREEGLRRGYYELLWKWDTGDDCLRLYAWEEEGGITVNLDVVSAAYEEASKAHEETGLTGEGDFRDHRWGDSREYLLAAEGTPMFTNDVFSFLAYSGRVANREAYIYYEFDDRDRLTTAEVFSQEGEASDFFHWEEAFTAKYGEPQNRDRVYTDDEQILARLAFGRAAEVEAALCAGHYELERFWETPTTIITLVAEMDEETPLVRARFEAKDVRAGASSAAETAVAPPAVPAEGRYEYAGAWGEEGEAPGQFQDPSGVAVAPDGTVYVADQLNHRIQHLSAEGQPLHVWGQFYLDPDAYNASVGWEMMRPDGEEAGTGEFHHPCAVAVAADGTVYVSDLWNCRIEYFTAEGEFLGMWGGPGEEEGALSWPYGVAAAPDGTVYVADTSNNRVPRFSAQGRFLVAWGVEGDGEGEFRRPHGLAVAADGTVYVADTDNNRIQYFTGDGRFRGAWGQEGSGPGEFSSPHAVAVGPGGDVFVSDAGNSRVQRFTAAGEFVEKWGGHGTYPGQFYSMEGLASAADGTVYVADGYNHRLQYFRPRAEEEPEPEGDLQYRWSD